LYLAGAQGRGPSKAGLRPLQRGPLLKTPGGFGAPEGDLLLDPSVAQAAVASYDRKKLNLGVTASHSAIDVCDGAADEGIRSVAFCQKGRDSLYSRYLLRVQDAGEVRGCVDEAVVLDRYDEQLTPAWQERMRKKNILYVPNRSFTSYCDLDAIEEEFKVPILGSRNLLRIEEREEKDNYYTLLEKGGLPTPEAFESSKDIDALAIVKLHHAKKKLERGFFTCASTKEFDEKAGALIKQGVITKADLKTARIERYVIGPVFNLNFFYSPITKKGEKLELLGVDWRFESSLDGHVRIPAPQQMTLNEAQAIPEMTVVGHNTATIRESLLGKVFELGEKFVKAAKKHYAPGIIGPFCLQTVVDKDMNFTIYDVAPRIGGGTNVHVATGHPYGNTLWRQPMSTGRRVALEVKRALALDALEEIVT
jgi:5-formaminoimidazole-4-carboxamide-1-(beta)-D-ribofuranosyl 5'-monophosphate synthetase